jgi:hypothetical protein
MSLLQDPETTTEAPTRGRQAAPSSRPRPRPLTVADGERPPVPAGDERPVHGPVQIDPSGRLPWRGMRIRRVRLLSVAQLSFVLWALAFAVLLGTAVVIWNVALAFGLIDELETAVVSSLGIDDFQVDGGALFGVVAVVAAFVCVLGWVMTILLAAVYNASCAVFGGLAIETGPLQRRKRVFSLRHGGFVTIRS